MYVSNVCRRGLRASRQHNTAASKNKPCVCVLYKESMYSSMCVRVAPFAFRQEVQNRTRGRTDLVQLPPAPPREDLYTTMFLE